MRVCWSWCGGCRCNKGSGMKTIRGPGIFLAQFAGAEAPFNTLDGLARWAGELGYKGVQIPTSDPALFDLERAAHSQTYRSEERRVGKECVSKCRSRWSQYQ